MDKSVILFFVFIPFFDFFIDCLTNFVALLVILFLSSSSNLLHMDVIFPA